MSTNQFHYLKYQLPYRRRNQARGLSHHGSPSCPYRNGIVAKFA